MAEPAHPRDETKPSDLVGQLEAERCVANGREPIGSGRVERWRIVEDSPEPGWHRTPAPPN
jgi:hypothetical protein